MATPAEGITESGTITPKRLKEIQQRCKDAQFGYTSCSYLEYYRDVSLLLQERGAMEERLKKVESVAEKQPDS